MIHVFFSATISPVNPSAFSNLLRTLGFWIRTSAARAGLQLISIPFQLLQSDRTTVPLTKFGLLMSQTLWGPPRARYGA